MATTELQKQAILHKILALPGVGPMSFWKAFKLSKNLESVYKIFRTRFSLEPYDADAAIQEMQDFANQGITCIGFWQTEYPEQLKRLNDAPPLIWAKGKVDFLHNPQIAIVGGRNASFYGIKFAKDLSESLCRVGFTVVSGLARGIDKAAHQGSLQNHTIAVLAGGIDKLYPQENADLYQEIVKNHLVISEMPPGVEPIAELFPRRNRIIAGLSLSICVIEAALKSGSLLTAKYGLDIDLPIFACPGHPYDPRTKGSNMLIKDGAYLLESAQDVVEQMQIQNHLPKALTPQSLPQSLVSDPDKLTQEILNCLSHTPLKIDALLKSLAHYPTELVLTKLAELELKNAIRRSSANLLVLG